MPHHCEYQYEKELCKLQYLAQGCLSTLGIRQVDIKSLSPTLDSDAWRLTPSTEGEAALEQELKKCLFNSLSSLKNVRTVRCVFHELFLNTGLRLFMMYRQMDTANGLANEAFLQRLDASTVEVVYPHRQDNIRKGDADSSALSVNSSSQNR